MQAEGISFEGKTTEEVFLDIRDMLAPTPNLLEDSYVNKAVTDAISDILKDTKVDIAQIDTIFNEELLSKLVCGTVTYYIYHKLISQATFGVLKNEKSIVKIQKFEKEAKGYGIMYYPIPNSNRGDGMYDIMVKEEDAPRINRLVERLKLASVSEAAKVKTEIEKSRK